MLAWFFFLSFFFFFNDTATTEIYTLSLHDALPHLPCFGTLLTHPLYYGDAYNCSKHNCWPWIARSVGTRRDGAGCSGRAGGRAAHGDAIIHHRRLPPLLDR